MTSFRFIYANFPNPTLSKSKISARLASFRRGLLATQKGWERPLNEDGTPDPQKWLDLSDDIRLSLAEQRKIDSRAERISDRHAASTGLQHLRMDDMRLCCTNPMRDSSCESSMVAVWYE
ncbi:hypothetical protein SAMN05216227_11121 [Pseudorhodobacter antarcticus]|jgi:hypothetical protein|uniref:Uncharacterized protein n=1 Tax=Pseudorhodobacter antarcticus TaxID=1077947 RepID=A0A1H8NY81_9RHOB|nr:hypothetical protein [Pseudorhodobacter antarcticus]SEO34547.1 hypothetical protein SAMN05216227_11121 [Pseudorhodobacter antarcticus]